MVDKICHDRSSISLPLSSFKIQYLVGGSSSFISQSIVSQCLLFSLGGGVTDLDLALDLDLLFDGLLLPLLLSGDRPLDGDLVLVLPLSLEEVGELLVEPLLPGGVMDLGGLLLVSDLAGVLSLARLGDLSLSRGLDSVLLLLAGLSSSS